MQERPLLPPERIHPRAATFIAGFHRSTVDEVRRAVEQHRVVVVGMGVNPHVARARRALRRAGIAYHYLEYGDYFRQWRRRLAIKMWAGWPLLPMVFVNGVLIGGADETEALLASGAFDDVGMND